MMTSDSSIPGITGTDLETASAKQKYKVAVSFSIHEEGKPHPVDTIHCFSHDEALLSRDQINAAINTFLGVIAFVGITPYKRETEEQLKETYEKAEASGFFNSLKAKVQ